MDQRDVLVADPLDVVLTKTVLEHRRALERLDGHDTRPVGLLEMVTGRDGAGRTCRRGERRQAQIRPTRGEHRIADRLEHMPERATRDRHVTEVIPELGELVQHEVLRIEAQLVAGVVDLLHVRLGAHRADDILRRVLAPAVEPVEALLAHPLRQDRHPTARHDPTDRDATAGVVARRRPHRAMTGRVELTGHHPRRETRIGGEHLVRGDHREPVTEHHDDRARHTGQRRRQHHVLGHPDPQTPEIVVPVDTPEVAGVRTLRIGVADRPGMIERRRIGQLGEPRQSDTPLAEPGDRVGERRLVDDPVGETELVLQGFRGIDQRHLDSLSKDGGNRHEPDSPSH